MGHSCTECFKAIIGIALNGVLNYCLVIEPPICPKTKHKCLYTRDKIVSLDNVILVYTCSFGAGIVVDSLYVPPLYNELLYDPLCALLLEDRSQSFSEVDPSQVSLHTSVRWTLVRYHYIPQ